MADTKFYPTNQVWRGSAGQETGSWIGSSTDIDDDPSDDDSDAITSPAQGQSDPPEWDEEVTYWDLQSCNTIPALGTSITVYVRAKEAVTTEVGDSKSAFELGYAGSDGFFYSLSDFVTGQGVASGLFNTTTAYVTYSATATIDDLTATDPGSGATFGWALRNLVIWYQQNQGDRRTTSISRMYAQITLPDSVLTAPGAPSFVSQQTGSGATSGQVFYDGQTFGGVLYIGWRRSSDTGSGSATTPSTDISISTDCGVSWSTLTTGVSATTYQWDTSSYTWGVVADCVRIRIRDSNGTPSSWVTGPTMFPPSIWSRPPYSTTTETYSTATQSLYTWNTEGFCSDAEITWGRRACDTTTWTLDRGSSESTTHTWTAVGV